MYMKGHNVNIFQMLYTQKSYQTKVGASQQKHKQKQSKFINITKIINIIFWLDLKKIISAFSYTDFFTCSSYQVAENDYNDRGNVKCSNLIWRAGATSEFSSLLNSKRSFFSPATPACYSHNRIVNLTIIYYLLWFDNAQLNLLKLSPS